MVSKPINLRVIWWMGSAALFSSWYAYLMYAPIIDLTVIIGYVVIILFWAWLPVLVMHWYLRGKDG